jgi:hypothetical protein
VRSNLLLFGNIALRQDTGPSQYRQSQKQTNLFPWSASHGARLAAVKRGLKNRTHVEAPPNYDPDIAQIRFSQQTRDGKTNRSADPSSQCSKQLHDNLRVTRKTMAELICELHQTDHMLTTLG